MFGRCRDCKLLFGANEKAENRSSFVLHVVVLLALAPGPLKEQEQE
jgi:ABC-type transport system involved in cytochrome c biogenesis permease component